MLYEQCDRLPEKMFYPWIMNVGRTIVIAQTASSLFSVTTWGDLNAGIAMDGISKVLNSYLGGASSFDNSCGQFLSVVNFDFHLR